MDAQRLRDSFARVAMHGDEVPLFFYSDLFLRHPETRELFPVSMAHQRDRLLQALATTVSNVDNLDALLPVLQGLGRDHRKFGALAEHYPAVGTSLLATLAHFCGDAWTEDLAADWAAAYQTISGVMIEAAREDEQYRPASWEATVVAHERRRFDIAVLRVAVGEPLEYLPGQSVSMESSARPRLWRFYSMANAPRPDSTMDFHVRMLDGGALSSHLARGLEVGARLRLGPPVGTLTYDTGSGRDILLVAGSTGLAPLKAILEQVSGLTDPPRVHLFFGSRTADGLYDLPDLEKLAAQYPWLTVVPSVSREPGFPGERGSLPDVVARSGTWREHDAYISGPTGMVEAMEQQLLAQGVPENQIRVEDFGWSEG
ncbi:MAG: oxidoreductase [Actinobacteria bacterium]|nr:oxidoreductase [Actinomycetota bacterium]